MAKKKIKNFQVDPYFVNGQHRITINVVGAGGTGSLLVTKLARLSMALNHLEHPGLFVKLIDFDKVEEFNVGRQMFTKNDIDDYKADIIISRINNAFGLDWMAKCDIYDEKDAEANIVISCVDNVVARKFILENFYTEQGFYVNDLDKKYLHIDCGNGRNYGQVILSDYNKKLKNIIDVFGKLEQYDNEDNQGKGCSYNDVLNEQDLFINDWVSLYAVQILRDLFLNKIIDYQGFFFNTEEHLTQKLMIV